MVMVNDLKSKGYYFGATNEIIDDFDVFSFHIDSLKKESDSKKLYRYVYSVNKPYVQGLDIPELKPGTLTEEEIDERDEFVEKYNADVCQKYWILIDENKTIDDLKSYLRRKIEKFIFNIYGDLLDNIHYIDSITLHENGDFISSHVDGNSSGRRCVVLIYLSDENSYNDGGGEVVVNDEVMKPTNNNFCIMDCLNHDLSHSTNKVKNDFKRFTYVNFIYNKKEFENNQNG